MPYKEKYKETFCYEFIAKHSNYSFGYLRNFMKDDEAVINYIEELLALGFYERKDKADFYSNPNLLDLSNRIKNWGEVRRFQKSKCKGAKKGTTYKKSESTKVSVKNFIETMNSDIESLKSELKEKMLEIEKLSTVIDSMDIQLQTRFDTIENLLLEVLTMKASS